MLDPDPHRRPAALANWIAQLRQSSLDDEILTVRLAPPAPARSRRSRGGGHSARSGAAPSVTSASWAGNETVAADGFRAAPGYPPRHRYQRRYRSPLSCLPVG